MHDNCGTMKHLYILVNYFVDEYFIIYFIFKNRKILSPLYITKMDNILGKLRSWQHTSSIITWMKCSEHGEQLSCKLVPIYAENVTKVNFPAACLLFNVYRMITPMAWGSPFLLLYLRVSLSVRNLKSYFYSSRNVDLWSNQLQNREIIGSLPNGSSELVSVF